MREELEKINRLIDNYLELIKRKEERIEMLKGFREQCRALSRFDKVHEANQDVEFEQNNINNILYKINELNNKMNNLVNHELIGVMYQSKEIWKDRLDRLYFNYVKQIELAAMYCDLVGCDLSKMTIGEVLDKYEQRPKKTKDEQ